jgi:type II secretory pathway pseudopilin PulG
VTATHRSDVNGTRAHRRRGVVLLATLVAMTLLAIGLMAAIDVWSLSRQRERERELMFVGDQYRQAIRRYYLAAPAGGARGYPPSLEVLLGDDRFPIPVRHLRRAYPDPITGKAEWGQLKVGERILGVYSLSEAPPIKKAGFPLAYAAFADAEAYKDWVFAYLPRRGALAPGAAASSAAPPSSPPRVLPVPTRRSPS